MGFLSFITGKKPFDAAAAAARVQTLRSIFPPGTEITLTEPSKDSHLEYEVELVGDRSRTTAMLAAIVEIVSTTQERWSVTLDVHDAPDERSAYSSIELPDRQVPFLAALMRAHDEMHSELPSQTIILDGEDGSFTVSDVPRDRAVATAHAAVRAWEGMLRDSDGRWSDSTLSIDVGVGIGPDGDRAEIIYGTTVEREPDPRNDDPVSDAEWAQLVFAAWNDNLPLLEAMLRLPVPLDHEAEFSFTDASLKPRLSVSHHETFEADKAAAKELVATLRAQVPGTKLKVG